VTSLSDIVCGFHETGCSVETSSDPLWSGVQQTGNVGTKQWIKHGREVQSPSFSRLENSPCNAGLKIIPQSGDRHILDHKIANMLGRIILQVAENPEPKLFVKTGRLEIEGIEINGVTSVLQCELLCC
jgi:hypothetical protein